MAVTPGAVDSSMNTFKGVLPPIVPYANQQRTNLILDFTDCQGGSAWGWEYWGAGTNQYVNVDAMSGINLGAVTGQIKAALALWLSRIQQGPTVTGSNILGNANYAYDIRWDGSEYVVYRVAIVDVNCLQWTEINTPSPAAGVRHYMGVVDRSVTIGITTANMGRSIQWGFCPFSLNVNL